MKTKYVRHGLISLCVIFHNNRTMWSTKLLVKICRWGGRKKSLILKCNDLLEKRFHAELAGTTFYVRRFVLE